MPHTDDEYLSVDLFPGEEADLTCRTVEIRKAAKQHLCFGVTGKQDHNIEPGERYRFEKALVDGSFWGTYRMCLRCMDKHIAGEY